MTSQEIADKALDIVDRLHGIMSESLKLERDAMLKLSGIIGQLNARIGRIEDLLKNPDEQSSKSKSGKSK